MLYVTKRGVFISRLFVVRHLGDDGGSFDCSGPSRVRLGDQEGGGGHVGITWCSDGGSFG